MYILYCSDNVLFVRIRQIRQISSNVQGTHETFPQHHIAGRGGRHKTHWPHVALASFCRASTLHCLCADAHVHITPMLPDPITTTFEKGEGRGGNKFYFRSSQEARFHSLHLLYSFNINKFSFLKPKAIFLLLDLDGAQQVSGPQPFPGWEVFLH